MKERMKKFVGNHAKGIVLVSAGVGAVIGIMATSKYVDGRRFVSADHWMLADGTEMILVHTKNNRSVQFTKPLQAA